jgi:hypothetical protein
MAKEPEPMPSDHPTTTSSAKLLWTGRVLSGLPVAFLLLDATMKLVKPEPVVKATVELGYPESVIVGLGIVLLVCTILYMIPRTSALGAILLTGYLGGACASHVRHGDGWFAILFPVVFGVLLWGGLWLRDERLRSLVPLRSRPTADVPG